MISQSLFRQWNVCHVWSDQGDMDAKEQTDADLLFFVPKTEMQPLLFGDI